MADDEKINLGLAVENFTEMCACTINHSGCESQFVDCGIRCPDAPPTTPAGLLTRFGVPVVWVLVVNAITGISYSLTSKVTYRTFFVGDRSLTLQILVVTLGCQALGISSTFINMNKAYSRHFWDGAVTPLGVGMSLLLNGFLFAGTFNRLKLKTLPDLFGKSYGLLAELLCSFYTLMFTLLAISLNLDAVSVLNTFLFTVPKQLSLFFTAVLISSYVIAGGRQSVVCTDIIQSFIGWSGTLVGTLWALSSYGAKDKLVMSDSPDKIVFWSGLVDANIPPTLPSTLVANWVQFFYLSLGNVMALDMQARTFSAATPQIAKNGNFIAGAVSIIIGLMWSLMGGTTRNLYGSHSVLAEYRVDSCRLANTRDVSENALHAAGLRCAEWVPDPVAPLKLFATAFPPLLGAWMFVTVALVAASTIDGALLSATMVLSKNFAATLSSLRYPHMWSNHNRVLYLTRICVLLCISFATFVATLTNVEPLTHATDFFFDIVVAACVPSLFASVYLPKTSPNAAIVSLIGGAITRTLFEFAFNQPDVVVSGLVSKGFGTATDSADSCHEDLVGTFHPIIRIVSPIISLLLLLSVTMLERRLKCDIFGNFLKSWRIPRNQSGSADVNVDSSSSQSTDIQFRKPTSTTNLNTSEQPSEERQKKRCSWDVSVSDGGQGLASIRTSRMRRYSCVGTDSPEFLEIAVNLVLPKVDYSACVKSHARFSEE